MNPKLTEILKKAKAVDKRTNQIGNQGSMGTTTPTLNLLGLKTLL